MKKGEGYTLMECVRLIQQRAGVSEDRAKEMLLEALRSGELVAYGIPAPVCAKPPCPTPESCTVQMGCLKAFKVTRT